MSTLRRLLGYLRPYAGWLVAGSLMLVISGALMGAAVATMKPLVNEVLLQTPAPASGPSAPEGPDILDMLRRLIPTDKISGWAKAHAFIEVPLLLVLVYFIRGIFGYFGQYLTVKAGASMIRDLRTDLYQSVAYQSPAFFQTHPTGLILSRIISDVQVIQQVATFSLANSVRVVAMVPFMLGVALIHDWRMTLVTLLALPILGYPMVRLGRRLRRAATASQEHMAGVAHKVSESVLGVRVVQGFGMERYEIGRFKGSVDGVLRAELKAGRAAALAPPIIELFAAIVGAVIFFLAGRSIAAGELDPGNFTVVLFCLGMLFASTRRLNAFYAQTQRALAASVRVFDMLDQERAIVDRPDARQLPAFRQEIRFDNVTFSYGDEQVLEGVELTIRRGEVVALVGRSGSGKTTLANLLPRFFDPQQGRVLIDGIDIRDTTLESLREQVGIVTQETILFDDTVRNNIAYGLPDTPQEQVLEVARAAHAHEFVENLPRQYDTMLGERGTRLSMGQRQRLTIARALLKNPPLLILDEATSALDAESEALVQEALETLMQGRTSLVIAHRLATVRRADRIVVLDAGRIVEKGTHEELLAAKGAYARLHELQFDEQTVR